MAGSLAIRRAGAVILAGGVVAYPTEAVWGLGCDPVNAGAVARILALKERPVSMGLILIAAAIDQLEPWLDPMAREVRERVMATWPGPVTWVLPAQDWVPAWLHGGRGSLAVRITAHAQAAALCNAAGRAIVSTSANRSGRPAARSGVQVRRWFGDELDFILGGATGGLERPSEIRDAISGRPIRAA